ncbi:MAG: hypothetical protein WCI25_08890 [Actinomycetes bacterium]
MGAGSIVDVSAGFGGVAHPADVVGDVAVAQSVGSGFGVGVGIGFGVGVGVGFGLEITGLFTTCQSFFFPT